MIKQIWFDLGKVLVDFRERKDVLAEIVARYCGKVDAIINAIFPPGYGEHVYELLDNGSMTTNMLWQRTCELGSISPDKLPFEDFSVLFRSHLKPIVPMIKYARELQERYPLVAVSNSNSRWVSDELLEKQCGIRFLRAFHSFEEGVKKPGLLSRVMDWARSLGVEPHECVFVDDIKKYTDAAAELGIQAICHDASVEPVEAQVKLLRQKLEAVGVCVA